MKIRVLYRKSAYTKLIEIQKNYTGDKNLKFFKNLKYKKEDKPFEEYHFDCNIVLLILPLKMTQTYSKAVKKKDLRM
jgi:hypothetical protein